MSVEQPQTPPEKPYKKYLEKIKSFFRDFKIKKNFEAPLTTQKEDGKRNFEKIILGVTIGFVFGALTSSIILYFKIKKIQEEYKKTQIRLKIFSSRLKSSQITTNTAQNQNLQAQKLNIANILSVINNLPPSNAFASFYVNKLNEEKYKTTQEREIVVKKPPPPPLPPLKTLIGKNQTSNNLPSISTPPPIPQISMIICSNNCYAISSNGQVYTNGFVQGNYRLVVTQNQIYWEKTDEKR
ncbi:hypothetical protein HY04AAS1_0726 [Hydrogenobaculum sp. Y04AAS1]|uniref:hypothetical protein n=1 Tax=Hydrogenobaculum sp. (strain Y04AAS1) TaxID=380749 RepID=UPI00015BD238|nr:hypothetical protein HY04AAS1_0726 [Hydrogenobaculum sp. Y04AAS1]HCT65953.1 hypothetical protein [Hydrogenobaculum sp.]